MPVTFSGAVLNGISAFAAAAAAFTPLSLFAAGEQGVWYDPSDMSTLYQDAAGTTPVTAVETAVGCILDRRNSSHSVYFDGTGDFITVPDSAAFTVGSGNFTIECWINNNTTGSFKHIFGQGDSSASSLSYWLSKTNTNKLRATLQSGGTTYTANTTADLPLNAWTHIAFVRNGNTGTLYVNGTADGTVNLTGVSINDRSEPITIGRAGSFTSDTWNGYISNLRMVVGTAVYTSNFTAPTSPLTAIANTVLLTCGNSWTGNPAFTLGGDVKVDKSNPFNTGTGNHATQSTSASRPVLSARVNLLTKTQELDDAAWTRSSLTAVNGATDPNGGSTADTLTASGASGTVTQSVTAVAADHTFSVWLKRKTGTGNVDISCHSGGTWVTQTITSSWARYSVTQTLTAGARTPGIRIVTSGDEVEAFGADLRVSNDGTGLLTYQRVNTSTDYDTTGFPMYLRFDGTDDSLATGNIDFSGTDKMSVWSGVRQVSTGTVTGQFYELSVDVGNNDGTFGFASPAATDATVLRAQQKGSIFVGFNTNITPPWSRVITHTINLSGDNAVLRANGSQVASSTSDLGTGNFGNYPLYIGSRAGSSLRFNGRLYSLIVRGAASDATQISDAESWVNSKTKAY